MIGRERWDKFKDDPKQYWAPLTSNCSTIVAKALKHGKPPKVIWMTPIFGLLRIFANTPMILKTKCRNDRVINYYVNQTMQHLKIAVIYCLLVSHSFGGVIYRDQLEDIANEKNVLISILPGKKPFYYQMADNDLRHLMKKVCCLETGATEEHVLHVLGRPNAIHQIQKKGNNQPVRGYRWSYRIIQYKKKSSNSRWDVNLVLIFDSHQKKLQSIRLVSGKFWQTIQRSIPK